MKNQGLIADRIADAMLEIPEGKITMRDDRLKESWTVSIQPFLISRFLISQEIYEEVTGVNPSTFEGPQKPVESVSWKESIEFCNLLSQSCDLESCYIQDAEEDGIKYIPGANGYRLPAEAEWEYACKAGTQEARYGKIDSIGWYKENSKGETREIGTKLPNEWGLYDMLGNVWEWCSDIYDETVYGSYRIIRGGGWNDEERGCLATNRRRSHPLAFRIDDLGFRIARNLD